MYLIFLKNNGMCVNRCTEIKKFSAVYIKTQGCLFQDGFMDEFNCLHAHLNLRLNMYYSWIQVFKTKETPIEIWDIPSFLTKFPWDSELLSSQSGKSKVRRWLFWQNPSSFLGGDNILTFEKPHWAWSFTPRGSGLVCCVERWGHGVEASEDSIWDFGSSQMALVIKNPPANARDLDSIYGSGRSPGEGNDNPLQYSCLVSPQILMKGRRQQSNAEQVSDMRDAFHHFYVVLVMN